ncbi:MAG: hypothetical protein V3U11_12300, partial [Planctomycetota bacterium]
VPIPALLKYTKQQYYSNGSICYAEGWALCQFLMHHENKKYKAIIPRYVFLIKNGRPKAVHKRVFRGIDLDKLNKEWMEWVTNVRMDGTVRGKEEPKDGEKGKDGKGKGRKKKKVKGPITPGGSGNGR